MRRTRVIIGGGSGIGRGAALAFAASGHSVVVADRNASAAEAVAREARGMGVDAVACTVDATDPVAVCQLRDFAEGRGNVDVLVHAAGVGGTGFVGSISLESWRRVIDVNLTAPFLSIQAFLPGMVAAHEGRIIVVGSQLGLSGAVGLADYCASKSGLHGLVKSVAREVAHHAVLVNIVAPGPTETPLLADLPPDARYAMTGAVPLGRIASVDEIVPTIELLAGPGGSYYTGCILSPSGGHTMH